jgi:PrtD family type I secretion system ABC transporter
MNWLFTPPLRRPIALAAAASLLLNLALLAPSLYLLQVFDRVLSSRNLETLAMLTLGTLLALGFAWAMDRARTMLLARAGLALDGALAAAAVETSLRQADPARHGLHLHDVARLRAFLSSPAVHALFDAPWLPLYVAVISLLHPTLGVVAVMAGALLAVLGIASERLLRRDSETASASSGAAGRHLHALGRHADVLRAMGMLPQALERWATAHREAGQAQLHAADKAATLASSNRSLRQGVQVAMVATGAWLVVAENASPGIMVAATLLASRALQPIDHLVAGWKSVLEVRGAWRRLAGTADLAERSALPGAARRPQPPLPDAGLRLDKATLLEPDAARPLIDSVTLSVPEGSCLGVIGPSGSGKTLLVRLMLGLRSPHAGTVLLDGLDLARWPLERRDTTVGDLPQDVELLDGSVARNIARLGPVDPERVVAAARLAGAHDMIVQLPRAYDTEAGADGLALSRGQRQRIGLARALYGLPRLVVLDEPDAALDEEGDAALARSIQELKRAGSTIVLVSHRPCLMRHADRLAVMRRGALQSFGGCQEVMGQLAARKVHAVRFGAPADASAAAPQGATA